MGDVHAFFEILVFLHVLFMAALVGGYFVAVAQEGVINPVMVWGARLQLLTGAAMMALAHAADAAGAENFDMIVGIKLLVALGVVACAEIAAARQRKGQATPALVHASGGLALVNFVIGMLAL